MLLAAPGKECMEGLFASIVEGSHDAIISKDLTETITSWNKGAERMFGYTVEEAVGKPISIILNPERANEMPAILERLKRGERVEHYETVRRTKEGRQVDVALTISPIYNAAGRIVGSSKIIRDITQRRQSEEALAKQARRVVRGQANLQQFAYIALHDLKEILRTLVACTEILLRGPKKKLNSEERELFPHVVTAAKRITHMVTDLLPYVRTLDEDLPAESSRASDLIDWALDNLRFAIRSSGAEVAYEPHEMPVLRCNRLALVQLFENLIGNSIKHCGSRRPRILISAERQDGHWRFSVTDNGIGIAAGDQDRIFTLFERLNQQECPGEGLGLTLCRSIVRAHGGEIWVKSDAGKGATFTFTLCEGSC
jgi:PAS domain S-box-containing protein